MIKTISVFSNGVSKNINLSIQDANLCYVLSFPADINAINSFSFGFLSSLFNIHHCFLNCSSSCITSTITEMSAIIFMDMINAIANGCIVKHNFYNIFRGGESSIMFQPSFFSSSFFSTCINRILSPRHTPYKIFSCI